jgi:hypothetical protein
MPPSGQAHEVPPAEKLRRNGRARVVRLPAAAGNLPFPSAPERQPEASRIPSRQALPEFPRRDAPPPFAMQGWRARDEGAIVAPHTSIPLDRLRVVPGTPFRREHAPT